MSVGGRFASSAANTIISRSITIPIIASISWEAPALAASDIATRRISSNFSKNFALNGRLGFALAKVHCDLSQSVAAQVRAGLNLSSNGIIASLPIGSTAEKPNSS